MSSDPTLDRLLRHMAWANAGLIDRLSTLPASALTLAAPRNEWTVAMILAHLVNAAGGYAARLEGTERPARLADPTDPADLAALGVRCAEVDARLLAQGAVGEGIVQFEYAGGTERRARSTVLAQAIHHATEHRAQIAEALATNGVRAVDLDALDLWAFGDAEGRGA